jgi:hypothetical protein
VAVRGSSASQFLSRAADGLALTSFTIMAWFYRVAPGGSGDDSAIAFGQDGTNVINVCVLNATNTWGLFDGTNDTNSGVVAALNTWFHLTMTCAGTGANQAGFFVNGKSGGTGQLAAGFTGSNLWFLGDGPTFGELFNGRVAQIKTWTRVLSAAEIIQEKNVPTAVARDSALNGEYALNKGGSHTADTSGNGNNLTDNGTTTDEADPPVGIDGYHLQQPAIRVRGPLRLKAPRLVPAPYVIVSPVAGGDVTVALTGSAATTAAGTVGVNEDVATTGQAAAAAQGTPVVDFGLATAGQAAATSQGTVAPAEAVALVGSVATVGQGSITTSADVSAALTGSAASVLQGSVTPSSDVPLVGGASPVSAGTVVPTPQLAVSGQSASTAQGSLGPSTSVLLAGAAAVTGQGVVAGPPSNLPRYQPSQNGRYLFDTVAGVPFFMKGDSGWLLPFNVTLANLPTYTADRQAKRFNTVIIQLMASNGTDGTVLANANGDLPFTKNSSGGTYTGAKGTADFSTPKDTYWAFMRSYVDALSAAGFLVIGYLDFLGFGGDGIQGCYLDFTLPINTNTVCSNFGVYLATGNGTFAGFKTCTSLVFADGGDYGASSGTPPSSTVETKMTNLITAMQTAGCQQLRYFDGNAPSESTDESAFTQYQQLQGTYSYGGTFPGSNPLNLKTYQEARRGFGFVPTLASQGGPGASIAPKALPDFLKETAYNHSGLVVSPPATDGQVRAAENWAWLSGATGGVVHGNDHIWPFVNGTWQTSLSEAGETDAQHRWELIDSIRWWELLPSELGGMRLLVTSSNGSQTGAPANYVAAACSADGKVLIAFFPSDGTTATQTATFDLRSMVGNVRLRWRDPTSGSFSNVSSVAAGFGTPAATTSALSLTTPGANAAGVNDWFLVVDTQDQAAQPRFPFDLTGPGRFRPGAHPERFRAGATTPAVTVALTGQAAAANFGTIGPVTTLALGGQAAATAQGSVAPEAALQITSAALAAGQGALAVTESVPLGGQAAAVQQGAVQVSIPGQASLAGQQATVLEGAVVATPQLPLTGVAAAGAAGQVGVDVQIALTGQTAAVTPGALKAAPALAIVGQQAAVAQASLPVTNARVQVGVEAISGTGLLGPAIDTGLTGASAATAQGSVGTTQPPIQPLSGIPAPVTAGQLGVDVTVALTGAAAAVVAGAVTPTPTIGLTGQQLVVRQGTLAKRKKIAAQVGQKPVSARRKGRGNTGAK